MKLFLFPKSERLTGDSQITRLFKEGIAVNSNPVRIVYRTVEITPGPRIRIMVTVPRKKFKKAVVRNRIKRLMREAYRHNKPSLPDVFTSALHMAFLYVGDKEEVTYQEIEEAMTGGMRKLLLHL